MKGTQSRICTSDKAERTRAEEQDRAQAIGVVLRTLDVVAGRRVGSPTPVMNPSFSNPPEYIMSCTMKFLASSTSACSTVLRASLDAKRPPTGRPTCAT